MNTVQLECFLAAAEYLNFTKAAEHLHITQPAVSHQISSLEAELSVQLFVRDNKNVELTVSGLNFISDALKIVEMAKSAKNRLHTASFSQGKTLEIYCHTAFEVNMLPKCIEKLQTEYPSLLPIIRFSTNYLSEDLGKSKNIELSFGFNTASYVNTNKKYIELTKCKMCYISSFEKNIEDFFCKDNSSFIPMTDRIILCHPLKFPKTILQIQSDIVSNTKDIYFHYCDTFESIITLAKSGFSIALFPDNPIYHDSHLQYYYLDTNDNLTFGIFYNEMERTNYKIVKRFASLLKEQIKKTPGNGTI